MSKKHALDRAADAVGVMSQAIHDYGEHSPEAQGAVDAARDTFLVARAHGATDDDLRDVHRA
ncbi:hypothetical protein ACWGIB_27455 [Streptomyces xiamenensis]